MFYRSSQCSERCEERGGERGQTEVWKFPKNFFSYFVSFPNLENIYKRTLDSPGGKDKQADAFKGLGQITSRLQVTLGRAFIHEDGGTRRCFGWILIIIFSMSFKVEIEFILINVI